MARALFCNAGIWEESAILVFMEHWDVASFVAFVEGDAFKEQITKEADPEDFQLPVNPTEAMVKQSVACLVKLMTGEMFFNSLRPLASQHTELLRKLHKDHQDAVQTARGWVARKMPFNVDGKVARVMRVNEDGVLIAGKTLKYDFDLHRFACCGEEACEYVLALPDKSD
jgi:hypothetical protein